MEADFATKPLASSKEMCHQGHEVVFDDGGSFTMNKCIREMNWLREAEGTAFWTYGYFFQVRSRLMHTVFVDGHDTRGRCVSQRHFHDVQERVRHLQSRSSSWSFCLHGAAEGCACQRCT